METYQDLRDHLEGIYIEHRDLKPSQQRFPESALIDELQEFSLTTLIEVFYDATGNTPNADLVDLKDLIADEDNSDSNKLRHPELFVPLGPTFLALLDSSKIVNKFNLASHFSSGVRLIVATLTENAQDLEILSYDQCALVRYHVARNSKTSKALRDRLKDDRSEMVREAAMLGHKQQPVAVMGSLVSSLLDGCPCQQYLSEEDFEEFCEEEELDAPFVASHLSLRLSKFQDWHWATQPFPLPTDDYLLTDTIQYLKNPVHDQFSFSHAGHGMNSYALNFRHVSGELAMIVQSAFGGVYGDKTNDSKAWNDLVLRINTLLIATSTISHDRRTRKYLLVASPFRLSQEIEFWKHESGQWSVLEDVNTWDAARDLLVAEFDPDEVYS